MLVFTGDRSKLDTVKPPYRRDTNGDTKGNRKKQKGIERNRKEQGKVEPA